MKEREFAPDEFWCRLRNGHYMNFYKSYYSVTTVCGATAEEVRLVRLREDPDGTHWGWEATGRGTFSMVQPSRMQLEMCFPYGMEVAVKKGDGRPVCLSVEELEP